MHINMLVGKALQSLLAVFALPNSVQSAQLNCRLQANGVTPGAAVGREREPLPAQ
jgi:hypothetical protein